MKNTFNLTKYITLVLENCDEILINIKDIDTLKLDNIYESLQYCDNSDQKIYQHIKIVKDFLLILKSSANKIHNQFGGIAETEDEKKCTVFERITQHHDITAIKLLDKNSKELDYIFVEYEEQDSGALGSPNILEKTEICKDDWNKKDICIISIKAK